MHTYCVGTMSSSVGWEYQSVPEAMSLHITYWFTTRTNQCKIIENVPSFYYLWMKYGKLPETLVDQCRNQLKLYFQELFPNNNSLMVDVAISNMSEGGATYSLNISLSVSVEGIRYDLARSVIMTGEQYKVLDEERLGT